MFRLSSFLPEFSEAQGRSTPAEWADEILRLEAFLDERPGPHADDPYAATHREVDRVLLSRVLKFTGGSQRQAARLLGIARQTLRLRLRELEFRVTHSVEADN